MPTPRAVTPGLQAQVEQLWTERLALQAAPPIDEVVWAPHTHDPLSVVGQAAMGLHEVLEAPQHRRRQSRATLSVMAMLALRRAE
jgi:hypothetical protein